LFKFYTTPYISQSFIDRIEKYKLKGLSKSPVLYFPESLEPYKGSYDYNKFTEYIDREKRELKIALEKENEENIKMYEKLIISQPNMYMYFFYLAIAYANKGDKKKTIEYIQRGSAINEKVKELVRKHLAFKPFFDDPDFSNLINS